MKELGQKLQPGGAAVIGLVRQANLEKLLPQIKIQGEVIQSSLGGDADEALRAALDAAGTSSEAPA